MYLNNRNAPPELLHYRILSRRMILNGEDARNLKIYESGFFGEYLYDKLFDEVGHDNLYIFRDVYLVAGKSGAQYDSIIISDDAITVNEIENIIIRMGASSRMEKSFPIIHFPRLTAQLGNSTGYAEMLKFRRKLRAR